MIDFEKYDEENVKVKCKNGFEIQGKCLLVTDEDTDIDYLEFEVSYGIEWVPINDIIEIELI